MGAWVCARPPPSCREPAAPWPPPGTRAVTQCPGRGVIRLAPGRGGGGGVGGDPRGPPACLGPGQVWLRRRRSSRQAGPGPVPIGTHIGPFPRAAVLSHNPPPPNHEGEERNGEPMHRAILGCSPDREPGPPPEQLLGSPLWGSVSGAAGTPGPALQGSLLT